MDDVAVRLESGRNASTSVRSGQTSSHEGVPKQGVNHFQRRPISWPAELDEDPPHMGAADNATSGATSVAEMEAHPLSDEQNKAFRRPDGFPSSVGGGADEDSGSRSQVDGRREPSFGTLPQQDPAGAADAQGTNPPLGDFCPTGGSVHPQEAAPQIPPSIRVLSWDGDGEDPEEGGSMERSISSDPQGLRKALRVSIWDRAGLISPGSSRIPPQPEPTQAAAGPWQGSGAVWAAESARRLRRKGGAGTDARENGGGEGALVHSDGSLGSADLLPALRRLASRLGDTSAAVNAPDARGGEAGGQKGGETMAAAEVAAGGGKLMGGWEGVRRLPAHPLTLPSAAAWREPSRSQDSIGLEGGAQSTICSEPNTESVGPPSPGLLSVGTANSRHVAGHGDSLADNVDGQLAALHVPNARRSTSSDAQGGKEAPSSFVEVEEEVEVEEDSVPFSPSVISSPSLAERFVDTDGTAWYRRGSAGTQGPREFLEPGPEVDPDTEVDRYGFVVGSDMASLDASEREAKTEVLKEQKSVRMWRTMIGTGGEEWKAYVRKYPRDVKRRIRRGVPDCLRGVVWQLLSGSRDLVLLNQGVYEQLVFYESSSSELDIIRDINRTFPSHVYFQQRHGPGQRALYNVLKAYSVYDREVGYVQGMGFLAGLLLLYMGEVDAFWLLVALLKGAVHAPMEGLYLMGLPLVQQSLFQFERLVQEVMPRLGAHLQEEAINPSMYASQWFITIFSYSFPFSTALRIWDVFLAEGMSIVFRVGLAVLKHCQADLVSKRLEELRGEYQAIHAPPTSPPSAPLDLERAGGRGGRRGVGGGGGARQSHGGEEK